MCRIDSHRGVQSFIELPCSSLTSMSSKHKVKLYFMKLGGKYFHGSLLIRRGHKERKPNFQSCSISKKAEVKGPTKSQCLSYPQHFLSFSLIQTPNTKCLQKDRLVAVVTVQL